jgi:hypothetical protein
MERVSRFEGVQVCIAGISREAPADVIGRSVKVMRIVTGEETNDQ